MNFKKNKRNAIAVAIAAALYAPTDAIARNCSGNALNAYLTYDEPCVIFTKNNTSIITPPKDTVLKEGASIYAIFPPRPTRFDEEVTITRDSESDFNQKTTGMVTVGTQAQVHFNKNFNLTLGEGAELNTRGVLIRGKHPAFAKTPTVTFNGEDNQINMAVNDSAQWAAYPGAGIENYGNLIASGGSDTKHHKTTITTDGALYGIAYYDGHLAFGGQHDLEIVSRNQQANFKKGSDFNDGEENYSLGSLLIAGVDQAGAKKAHFKAPVTITQEAGSEGAGLIQESRKYYPGYSLHLGDKNTGGSSTPVSHFEKSLTINTQSGAGVIFGGGEMTQDTLETLEITSKSGTGIHINQSVGTLADGSQATKNWINFGRTTGDSSENNPESLNLGFSKDAHINTGNKGIYIAGNPSDHVKNLRLVNEEGSIHAKDNAIDFSQLTPRTSEKDKQSLNDELVITITNSGTLISDDGYAYYGNDYNESFESTGGIIKGHMGFADGFDTLTISDTDITEIGKLDGGTDTGTDNEFDILTFGGGNKYPTAGLVGDNLMNWERVDLKSPNETFKLGGNLTVGDKKDGSGLFIDPDVTVTPADGTKITGNVTNKGTIDLTTNRPADTFSTVTIDGNYEGGTDADPARLKMGLNSENNKNDLLQITGKATGKTIVEVDNTTPGKGKVSADGIKLVGIAGGTEKDIPPAFVLDKTKPIQYEAHEYTEIEFGTSAGHGAYLKSKATNPDSGTSSGSVPTVPSTGAGSPIQNTPSTPNTSGNSGSSSAGSSETVANKPTAKPTEPSQPIMPMQPIKPERPYQPEIYRPAVSGYAMAQHSNVYAVSGLLGNHLHQRVGEQESFRWNNNPNEHQIWGRVRGESLKLNGKTQFSIEQNNQLLQFGWDLDINRDDQNRRQHTGLFASYARTDADTFDRKRPLIGQNTQTGKLKGDIFGIGAYHTRYDEQGNYIDLIGDVHVIHNRYSDVYSGSSKQTGWGLAASVEGGRKFDLSEKWFVEPQAELTWQSNYYNAFNDNITDIAAYNHQSLRPRLGVRIGFNDKTPTNGNSTNFYATGSIVHEMMAPSEIIIGSTAVKERIGKDTWLELGIGGQVPIGKQTYLYGEAEYLHTLNNDAHRGVTGQIGLRYSW